MREGTRPAKALFRRGAADGGPCGDVAGVEAAPTVDLRGAFTLQYAIVGLLRGVASMEENQLDTSLARLWEADALAARDVPWVGRKVVSQGRVACVS